ncbi:MAG: DUF6438 domain-containing protein [Tahibacter sp.]
MWAFTVKRALYALTLCVIAGCTAPPAYSEQAGFESLTLERTPCFGGCPIYSATVDREGEIRFQGTRFVAATGPRAAHISPTQVAELATALNAAHFSELHASYRTEADGCTALATDHPGTVIRARIGGVEKSVNYYTGCSGIAEVERIAALARRIDEIAGTQRWIVAP